MIAAFREQTPDAAGYTSDGWKGGEQDAGREGDRGKAGCGDTVRCIFLIEPSSGYCSTIRQAQVER